MQFTTLTICLTPVHFFGLYLADRLVLIFCPWTRESWIVNRESGVKNACGTNGNQRH